MPDYYDSLALLSPSRFNSLPGLPFADDGNRYPHRAGVVGSLTRHSDRLEADVRTRTRAEEVRGDSGGFLHTDGTGSSARPASSRPPAPSATHELIDALGGRRAAIVM